MWEAAIVQCAYVFNLCIIIIIIIKHMTSFVEWQNSASLSNAACVHSLVTTVVDVSFSQYCSIEFDFDRIITGGPKIVRLNMSVKWGVGGYFYMFWPHQTSQTRVFNLLEIYPNSRNLKCYKYCTGKSSDF